jgi:hypothetical protein
MQGPQLLRLVELSSFLCFSIFCGGEISLLASLQNCRVLQRFSSSVPWLARQLIHCQHINLLCAAQHSEMHPLPPPPNRGPENQSALTRPSVAPIQETSAGAEQSNQSYPQPQPESKKKRKHRGKKTKRNRRQSFAAPSEGSSMPSAIPEVITEQHGMARSNSGLRDSYYRLGQPGRNLSNTSLESEALLDHR